MVKGTTGMDNVFMCLKCDRAYVLPSCCSHYQDARILELEAEIKKLLAKEEAKEESPDGKDHRV